jgi:hypothetical protein
LRNKLKVIAKGFCQESHPLTYASDEEINSTVEKFLLIYISDPDLFEPLLNCDPNVQQNRIKVFANQLQSTNIYITPYDKLKLLQQGADKFCEIYKHQSIVIKDHYYISKISSQVDLCVIIGYDDRYFDIDYLLQQNRKETQNNNKFKYGYYCFDYLKDGPEMRSPEFIKLITEECFYIENDMLKLKSKYEFYPYISPKVGGDEIHLSPRLISLCNKTYKLKQLGMHYGILGDDDLESIETRIENKIISGRCDRIYPLNQYKHSCQEDSAIKLLKEHNIKIKTARVYFPGQLINNSGINNRTTGTWKRIIVD